MFKISFRHFIPLLLLFSVGSEMLEGVLVGLGLLHVGQLHVPPVARQLSEDPEVDVVLSSHMDLHGKERRS